MFSTRLAFWGALVTFPALAQVTAVSPAQNPEVRIARHQLSPIKDKLVHLDGSAESTNWSGYAVLGSAFTSAEASWTVPASVCSTSTGSSGSGGNGGRGGPGQNSQQDEYAAFWVGLDGYSSSTVEQTGTLSECVGSEPVYYAWYEFYPNPMYEVLTVPVSPGNVMSASVTYSSSGKFTVTITNVSTGKSYTTSSSVKGAARSSAEWITEAPCCTNSGGILPLADFGTVNFGLDYTSVAGTNFATDSTNSGNIGSFGSANVQEINKVPSSTSPQASNCSPLTSDGTSFTCTWASN